MTAPLMVMVWWRLHGSCAAAAAAPVAPVAAVECSPVKGAMRQCCNFACMLVTPTILPHAQAHYHTCAAQNNRLLLPLPCLALRAHDCLVFTGTRSAGAGRPVWWHSQDRGPGNPGGAPGGGYQHNTQGQQWNTGAHAEACARTRACLKGWRVGRGGVE